MTFDGRPKWTPPSEVNDFGQLVSYQSDLYGPQGARTSPVDQMKLCLDRGFFLLAEVLSGFALDSNPDHYLLILAFEANAFSDEFAYWDADSNMSNTIEKGFGTLYCVPGREATVYSRFGNTFANGRFSTGSTEDKLRLIDGKDGHYQCADANCTNDPMEKRYFVLRARPVP